MLLEETIPIQNIDAAETKLKRFANEFEKFYGKENVAMNHHLLTHIANAVRHNGPLWAQSAFGFESNNGILAKISSKKHILHELAWKYTSRQTLCTGINKKTSPDIAVEGKLMIEIPGDIYLA